MLHPMLDLDGHQDIRLTSVYIRLTLVYTRLTSVYTRLTSVYIRLTSVYIRLTSVYIRSTSVYIRSTSVYVRSTLVYNLSSMSKLGSGGSDNFISLLGRPPTTCLTWMDAPPPPVLHILDPPLLGLCHRQQGTSWTDKMLCLHLI